MRTVLALIALGLGGCSSDFISPVSELRTGFGSSDSSPSLALDELVDTTEAADSARLGNVCEAPGLPSILGRLEDAARGMCDDALATSDPDLSVLGTANAARGLAPPTELAGTCRTRIQSVLRVEGLPGATELEKERARVLSYAKAEPVLFIRAPAVDASSTPAARTYRSMLERSSSPWGVLQKLTLVFTLNPSLGRSVLLREGYLYADRPELAFALVDLVKAHHLFDAPRIWIERGEETIWAVRTQYGQYVYEDGPQAGQRVRLLLFDRIGSEVAPPPLHRDVRSLRRRLGFDRMKVDHITANEMLVELRYGGVWVPTVLTAQGARLERDCEHLPPDLVPRVEAARDRHERAEPILRTLRRVILDGVEEGLPFDEPLTEYGQQDGQLRRFWLRAYTEGKPTYEMNGDRYNTFDVRGRPLVPQVCVDFIFDTLERASGTWWRTRDEPPGRARGQLNFGTIEDETMRRASSFIALAEERKDWFDTWQIPDNERIPLKDSNGLVTYLTEHADDFVPGDIVLIRGYAPWDKPWRPRVMHYHSFFVYETDPITGFPSMLVGNPGRPLLQTWQFEAFRTPDRSIWYRMRPRLEWLEQVVQSDADSDAKAASVPLAGGPS